MKLNFCLMGLLCLFFEAKSQTPSTKKFLQPGDRMPDVTFTNFKNSKLKSAKISDYKGKLIILDFWNPWCAGCIKSFPKMDSLQKKYADKLKVFLVNPARDHDSERSVNIVINRMNAWMESPFRLPIVYSDTVLTNNFDFKSVPHYVWISPDGIYLAATDPSQVTTANIEGIASGKKIELVQKTERKTKTIQITP